MYRVLFVAVLLLCLNHEAARGGQTDSGTVVYEQWVECSQPCFGSESDSCLATYHVDSVPIGCQGIVTYIRDEYPVRKDGCIRVTLYVVTQEGVDTLYNCCGDDGLRIVNEVPIGAYVCYRHPADDTHWVSPAAIWITTRRPWCIVPDYIRNNYPFSQSD